MDAGEGSKWHIHFDHMKLGNLTKSRIEFNGRPKRAIFQELGEKINRHNLNIHGDLKDSFDACIAYIRDHY